MSKKYKPVTHVIIETDGLLLDTEPIAAKVMTEVVESYRKTVPLELTYQLQGRSEKDFLNMLIKEVKLPVRFPTLKEKYNKVEEGKYTKTKMMPGGERLVCHLTRHNVPLAATTSGRIELIDPKFFSYKGLFLNLHHIVSGSDEEVEQSKPDPTIFKVCAARFENPPDPADCLVLDCSPAGVAAACCAGMQVVAVPDPLLDPELIKDATLVVPTLADFKPQLFGLPKIPH